MTRISWDQTGDRQFETGIDHGVLFLSDGSGVAWNGLTSVEENGDESPEALYKDGLKYLDLQALEDFSAKLTAFTYPDEFLEFDGQVSIGSGISVDDQNVNRFSISYRTRIGNDVDGPDYGYKIHIIYNLLVTPDSNQFNSNSDSISPVEFAWTVQGVPVQLAGYRPTTHIILDTTKLSPLFISDLEDILYGTETTAAHLPPFAELSAWIIDWAIIRIVDNGDGTWSATGPTDRITMLDSITFQITQVDAVYIDADTYNVSTTRL